MAGGPVNRNELESFYQNPGDIYDDAMTEGAFGVIAGQIDANWFDYKAVKDQLQSTTLGASGSELVKSPTVNGLNGNTVYAQIVALVAQIQEILNANIPDASITYPKLASDVVAAFVNTSGDMMTGPLTIRPAGELSSVIGSIADLLLGIKDTGTNNSYLFQRFLRVRAGTDWTTVDLEIGRQTDSTIQQRIVMTGDGLMVFTAAADIRAKIDSMGTANAVSIMQDYVAPGDSATFFAQSAGEITESDIGSFVPGYAGKYKISGNVRTDGGSAASIHVRSDAGPTETVYSTTSQTMVAFSVNTANAYPALSKITVSCGAGGSSNAIASGVTVKGNLTKVRPW